MRRDEIMRLYCEERVREWTNQRVRSQARAGRPPGPESSVGKVHQGELNQRVQLAATSVLGMGATAWAGDLGDYAGSLPYEVRGMLRSRANTIEGGTTEINKNILGERVLGLPREPDPYASLPVAGGAAQLSAYSTLLVEREGPVGWLIFNRPQSGNAMDARHARRAGGGLARAGRGSRRPGHREHGRGRRRSRPASMWSSSAGIPTPFASSPGARAGPSCA